MAVKTLRNSALIQEWGGVGYYPTSGVPSCMSTPVACACGRASPASSLQPPLSKGQSKYLPIDGKPITPQDYKLAMAKGLPGRNTLLASVRPAPKPAAEPAVQTAANQPIIQPVFRHEFEPAVQNEPQPPQALLASYVPDAPLTAPAVASAPAEQAAPCRIASASSMPMPAAICRSEAAIELAELPALSERRGGRSARG